MQDISITNIVLVCISFLGVGFAVIAIQSVRKLSLRLSKAVELINSLHKLNQANQTKFDAFEKAQTQAHHQHKQALALELEQTITQFNADNSKRHSAEVEAIKLDVDRLAAQIEELAQQDPAAKMYAKAHSLVAAGASIAEIMDACDLPQAEVEVLIGFQEKART